MAPAANRPRPSSDISLSGCTPPWRGAADRIAGQGIGRGRNDLVDRDCAIVVHIAAVQAGVDALPRSMFIDSISTVI
jgi:hypothetical protein